MKYSLNQWLKLVLVIDDSRLSIDNNRAEYLVRPS
ncbi:transposase [Vibrio sp. 10N.286.51.E5]